MLTFDFYFQLLVALEIFRWQNRTTKRKKRIITNNYLNVINNGKLKMATPQLKQINYELRKNKTSRIRIEFRLKWLKEIQEELLNSNLSDK